MRTRSAARAQRPTTGADSAPQAESGGSVTAGGFGSLPAATQQVLSPPSRVTRSPTPTGVTAGTGSSTGKGKKRVAEPAQAVVPGTTTLELPPKRPRTDGRLSQAGPSGLKSYPDSYEDVTPTQRTLEILAVLPLRSHETHADAPAMKLPSDFLALHYMSENNADLLNQFETMDNEEKVRQITKWMVLKSTKVNYKKTGDPLTTEKSMCQMTKKNLDSILWGNPGEGEEKGLEYALKNFANFCALGEQVPSQLGRRGYTRLRALCFSSCLPVAEAFRKTWNHAFPESAATSEAVDAGSSSKSTNKKAPHPKGQMFESNFPTLDTALAHQRVSPDKFLNRRYSDDEFFRIIEGLRTKSYEGALNSLSLLATTWRLHQHPLAWDPLLQEAANELEEQHDGSRSLNLLAARVAEFLEFKNMELIDFFREVEKFELKGEGDQAQWSWSTGTVNNPLIKEYFTRINVVMDEVHRDSVRGHVHKAKQLLNAPAIRAYRTKEIMAPLRQKTVFSLDEITTALSSIQQMKRHVVFSLADNGNVVVGYRDVPIEGGSEKRFSHEQMHDASLNAVFPFRDPDNPIRVHRDFANPADPAGKAVAQNVTIDGVIIPGKTETSLWELARGNTSLTKQDFFEQYRQGLREELMATMNNEAPPSSKRMQVVRLTEEQCETDTEKVALKGQYGVIPRGECPVLPETYGLFGGSLIIDDVHEDAYERTFTDAKTANRAAKNYGVAAPASEGEFGPEYFPYGGGDDRQYFNCAFKPDDDGMLVADEDRCHAIFLPVTIKLTDAAGQERELPIMNVVPTNNRPDPRYQIMLSYGPGYTLDIAQSVAEQVIKPEPQD